MTVKHMITLLVALGLTSIGLADAHSMPSSISSTIEDNELDSDGDGMPDWYELQYQGQIMFQDHFEDGSLDSAWVMKRTFWEESDGRMKTVPQSLPAFNYGHSGNGRGPVVVLREGAANWTDYSYEFICAGTGVVPEFNPHYLPVGFIGWMGTKFRVEEYPESWNEPEVNCYNFSLTLSDAGNSVTGDWGMSATESYYIPGTGWHSGSVGSSHKMVSGNSPAINPGSQINHVRILVRDNRAYSWVNGVFLGEGENFSDCAPYGGIAFSTTWEAMAWIDDVVVRFVGLDPNWPDADLDYDQDGLTNFEEYQNGTDPIEPNTSSSRIPRIEGELNFGSVAVGSTCELNIEVWNDGNSELSVSNVISEHEFTVQTPAFTVPAGGSTTLTIAYAPISETVSTGMVTLVSNATSGTNEFFVSGLGVSPSLQDTDGDGMPDWYELQYVGQVMFEDSFDDGTLDPAWVMKRTYWEEADGKLKSVPSVLPGYDYGHWGEGRGTLIMLNEGNVDWTDYSYEFKVQLQGVHPSLNPHSLPIGYMNSVSTYFRVIELPDDWNEPARTHYGLGMTIASGSALGSWSTGISDAVYIPGQGWSSSQQGAGYTIGSGNTEAVNPDYQENHMRILVRDNRRFMWCNGEFLGESIDTNNVAPYGGIGLSGGSYECMAEYDDVFVRTVGLDPDFPDGDLDYDNDGVTNFEEYQNGTDPIEATIKPSRIPRFAGNLEFGDVNIGSSSNRSLEVWNDGNSTLTVSNVIYDQELTVLPTEFSLPSGGSTNLTVTYTPADAGVHSSMLSLISDATDGVTEISASGMGVVPVSPDAIRTIEGLTAIIHITVPEDASVLGVEDQLSYGLVAYDISDGGVWDPATQKVKWLFSKTGQVRDRALQYRVNATGAALGGLVNFGELNATIQGDMVFSGGENPGLLHPADDNGDWSLNLQEVSSSVSRWKNGIDSIRVPIVTRGVTIYLQGEKYRYDDSASAEAKRWIPLSDTSNLPGLALMSETLEAETATRSINFTNIQVSVSPAPNTAAWGLSEYIPQGSMAESISHGGVWDAVNRQIKWIFYDGVDREISYSLSAAPGASFDLQGEYSFDGSDETVAGDMTSVVPRTFSNWLEQQSIIGDAGNLFTEHNKFGIPYGLAYAFGENLTNASALLNVRVIDGVPYAETPKQDPSSVPFINLSILGAEDLTTETWNLNALPVPDQSGTPEGKLHWILPTSPDQAYYRIQGSRNE